MAVMFARDTSDAPRPSTWDYCTHAKGAVDSKGERFASVALCTCPKGHTCGLSRNVHSVEDVTGRMSPSYVCPMTGCGFHEFVSLAGWSWEWFHAHCAPDRA
jgi:hypothetical protein